MSFAERATDLGYAAGWRLVRSLPESVAVKLFDAGADFAVRKGGPEQLSEEPRESSGHDAGGSSGSVDQGFDALVRPVLA